MRPSPHLRLLFVAIREDVLVLRKRLQRRLESFRRVREEARGACPKHDEASTRDTGRTHSRHTIESAAAAAGPPNTSRHLPCITQEAIGVPQRSINSWILPSPVRLLTSPTTIHALFVKASDWSAPVKTIVRHTNGKHCVSPPYVAEGRGGERKGLGISWFGQLPKRIQCLEEA